MEEKRVKEAPPFLGSEFPEEHFRTIRELLLSRRGLDLDMYKDKCIKRRIATRVRARGCDDAGSYAALLQEDGDEVTALMTALTIHVTQFFRNPTTFAALEGTYLPDFFSRCRQSGRQELRIWSVGCSSGEEPYSLALLLDELRPRNLKVSIRATDLSPVILEKARQGCYDPQRLAEVPEGVRDKYFVPEGGSFRLHKRVRAMVEFERQDILSEAPYPDADLILCRNVLIYFAKKEQERILRRFAGSLSPGGLLVLGKAETLIGEARRLFQAEDLAERIYRKAPAETD